MEEQFRYLFNLPTTSSQNKLQTQAKAFIDELGFSNLLLEDSSLYSDVPMFCVHINMGQDFVVEGMPKQVSILCDLRMNKIQVSYLASSYIAEDDNSYLDYKDLEFHDFTWDKLKELVIKYHADFY